MRFATRLILCGFTLTSMYVLLARPAAADEDSTAVEASTLHAGAKALMFEITAADLRPFEGAVISFKRHLSPTSALRLGFDLLISVGDEDIAQNGIDINSDIQAHQAGASLQYVHYASIGKPINFYLLTGVRGAYLWQKDDRSYVDTYYGDVDERFHNDVWSASLRGGIGAEWFPARKISLLAEYRTGLTVYWQHRYQYRSTSTGGGSTVQDRHLRQLYFGGEAVRFGLSLYF